MKITEVKNPLANGLKPVPSADDIEDVVDEWSFEVDTTAADEARRQQIIDDRNEKERRRIEIE